MNTMRKEANTKLISGRQMAGMAAGCVAVSLIIWGLMIAGIRLPEPVAPFAGSPAGFLHGWFQITSLAVAVFVGVLCYMNFEWTGALTLPILGSAFIAGGILDLVHLLIVQGWIPSPLPLGERLMLTWTLARIITLAFLLVALAGFLISESLHGRRSRRRGIQFAVLITLLLCGGAAGLLLYSVREDNLLAFMHASGLSQRIMDWLPVVLAAVTGFYVMPTYMKWKSNVFGQMIILSCLSLALAQIHLAIIPEGGIGLALVGADLLKLIAYALPLTGMFLDYHWTYENMEKSNRALKSELFKEAQIKEAGDQHQRHLEALMIQMREPVIILDSSLRIIKLNAMQSRLTAMDSPLAGTGKSPEEVFDATLAGILVKGAKEAMDLKRTISVSEEWMFSSGDDQTLYRWNVQPILDSRKNVIGAVCVGRETRQRDPKPVVIV